MNMLSCLQVKCLWEEAENRYMDRLTINPFVAWKIQVKDHKDMYEK